MSDFIALIEFAGALSLTITGSVLLTLAGCGSGPRFRRRGLAR